MFSSDLRIRVLTTGLATYPDVTVVCGPTEADPESASAVTNPALIVEVTSEGTEAYGRSEKLEHYKTVTSLRAILLMSQAEPRVEAWLRGGDGVWTARRAGSGEAVELPSLGCRLEVDEIYRGLGVPGGLA